MPTNDTTYMLTYDHGGQILWGVRHFRERLQNGEEWLKKYPRFKMGLENEAHVYDYFAQKDPSLLGKIRNMMRKYKGRFSIGTCSYGQPLMTFINEESNVRQLLYAREANLKYFGYSPSIFLMSEHAMHAQLPQLLKSLGYKGAILRTHYMMYGYNPTFPVPIGNWVGLDGTRLPAIPTYTGEGAAFGKTTIDNWTLTRYPGSGALSPTQLRQMFWNIRPLLASRADDAGLRKEELVKQYKDSAKFAWILLDDLLAKYPKPEVDMPTGPNDFTVRMPWGYCGNEIWNGCRRAEMSVLTAERLAALECVSGGYHHEGEVREAWKNLLVAQHHDVQIVGLLSQARSYLGASLQYSERVQQEALHYFSSGQQAQGLSQVTVFNPLSWAQEKWIAVPVSVGEKGTARSFQVRSGKQQYPVRLVNANYYSDRSILDGQLYFLAKLPPLSVTSFSIIGQHDKGADAGPTRLRVDPQNLTLSNPFLEMQLGRQGGIQWIVDKRSGARYQAPEGPVGFFQGSIDGVACTSKGTWVVEATDSVAPYALATEYGMVGGIPYRFELKLFEDEALLQCKVSFDINGQKIGLVSQDPRDSHAPFVHDHKLRFTFSPGLNQGHRQAIRDLPFAIAPAADSAVQGIYWTALSDGNRGVAFFNKGNMGSLVEKDGSFSLLLAYAMYYIWGTRMLKGTYSYEFSLVPFSGPWQQANLHRRAIAYNFPVPYVLTAPGSGKASPRYQLFKEEATDPMLSAFYTVKGQPIARYYEYEGKKSKLVLQGTGPHDTMEWVQLDGSPVISDARPTTFQAWQIKTYHLKSLGKRGPVRTAKGRT